MDKSILSTLFCIIFIFPLQSQTLKQWLNAADEAYDSGDYYEAFSYYEVALEYDDEQVEVWRRYATAALKFKAYGYAEKAYQYILNLNPNDKPAQYWMAYVQQRQGKYELAQNRYNQFLTNTPDSLNSYIEKASKHLEDCGFALLEIEQPKEMEIRHLDTLINTPDSEFSPFQTGDTLYYSSLHYLYEKDKHNPPRTYSKVLTSVKEMNTLPVEDINVAGKHVSNTTFNTDHSKLFYTICDYINDEEIRCDLYFRARTAGGFWTTPVKLEINEGGATTTHPAVGWDKSVDKEILFFVSNRYGGKGGLDIWCAYMESDGSLGEPFNLEEINTPENDITPYFHTPSQRLYFSSEGYNTLGGYDIYNTQNTEGSWSPPYNMGAPLNSSYDEAYYYRSDCSDAYFSSNRLGSVFLVAAKETCCNDIYAVKADLGVELDAFTFNDESKEDLAGVQLELYEVPPNGAPILLETITNPTANDFTVQLERCRKYELKASKRGFRTSVIPIDLGELGGEFGDDIPSEYEFPKEIKKDIFLEPLMAEIVIKPCDTEDPSAILTGVIARFSLINEETGALELLDEKEQIGSDELTFRAPVNKTYQLQLEKEDYLSRIDTFELTDETILQYGEKIKIDACMTKNPLPPVMVYFDNNVPARHPNTYTNSIYDDLFQAYYGKKGEFVETFSENLAEGEQFRVAQGYESFFERQVKIGELKLESFAAKLLEFLKEGNSFKIKLKGFSSPRGQSDYNKLLSSRRIDSIINFFEEYNKGEFNQFIKSGQLEFVQESYGESTAAERISDNLKDRKNSIFSVVASVERRVEITVIKTEDE